MPGQLVQSATSEQTGDEKLHLCWPGESAPVHAPPYEGTGHSVVSSAACPKHNQIKPSGFVTTERLGGQHRPTDATEQKTQDC